MSGTPRQPNPAKTKRKKASPYPLADEQAAMEYLEIQCGRTKKEIGALCASGDLGGSLSSRSRPCSNATGYLGDMGQRSRRRCRPQGRAATDLLRY